MSDILEFMATHEDLVFWGGLILVIVVAFIGAWIMGMRMDDDTKEQR